MLVYIYIICTYIYIIIYTYSVIIIIIIVISIVIAIIIIIISGIIVIMIIIIVRWFVTIIPNEWNSQNKINLWHPQPVGGSSWGSWPKSTRRDGAAVFCGQQSES